MAFARRAIAFLAAAIAAGTLAAQAPPGMQPRINVVASFSILADVVHNVGGERVDVAALVARNSDAHVYAPTPADSKRLVEARLVVVNGLGFEGWFDRLIAASGSKAAVVVASKGIEPRPAVGDDHDRVDKGGASDPHAWQSIANMKRYVANIRDALIAVDPAGRVAYANNAGIYLAKLDALEAEIKDAVAKIPAERRRVIIGHNAFGYFQDAYGIVFLAPQGISTDAEPSARDIARIVTQIRANRIPAIFLENVVDPRMINEIAHETGAKIGGTLYSDALTDTDGPAPTYIDLMRHNVRTFLAALAG